MLYLIYSNHMSIIEKQLIKLGWQPNCNNNSDYYTMNFPDHAKKHHSDYTLFVNNLPLVSIKAKKQNHTLFQCLEESKKIAKFLNIPLALATDGYRTKAWHVAQNTPLLSNNTEVEEIFNKKMALFYVKNNHYESLMDGDRNDKKYLISKFKEANDVLRADGLDVGILRFSEFANLMFLKLNMEANNGLFNYTWNHINNYQGVKLKNTLNDIFAKAEENHFSLIKNEKSQKDYLRLLGKTKIKNTESLEKIIKILNSINLSAINDDAKGMAFEYFIHSYTSGLKNDLGQYFTPRHIIKLMVNYLKPQVGEQIYDPFCGTGGMLIECFKFLMRSVSYEDKKSLALIKDSIHGRDNSGVARIALMNMIMFVGAHSSIKQLDSYANISKARNQYDIVIANMPFSQSTHHTEGYPVVPKNSKNGDSIGVQHCLESLSLHENARAAIIVPIGFIHKKELKDEREWILNNFTLDKVVELTPKCFNPYTEQQTAILMIKRKKSSNRNKSVYYKIENDGFSQDGYRVPVPGMNDVDNVMENQNGVNVEFNNRDFFSYKKIHILAPRGKYKLLGDLAKIKKGDNISPKTELKYIKNGSYPILMTADLAINHIDYYLNASKYLLNNTGIKNKKPYFFPQKTIIIPTSGKSCLLNHRAMLGIESYLTSTLTGIIAEKVDPFYLFYFLLNFDSKYIVYDQGYPGIKVEDIKNIPIPIYNRNKTQSIVSKISNLVLLHKKFKESHNEIIIKN